MLGMKAENHLLEVSIDAIWPSSYHFSGIPPNVVKKRNEITT